MKPLVSIVNLEDKTLKILKGKNTIYKQRINVIDIEDLGKYSDKYYFDLSEITNYSEIDFAVILSQKNIDSIDEAICNSVCSWEKYQIGFTIIQVSNLLFKNEALIDYNLNEPYDA
ncbi:hypothetical protein C0585_02395 [Candidatus Woesearchaeota archaeon]|nr:MAG: hypothetical protein C0585_02395 [Candidatus Woesearchaeota archaeon]